MSNNSSIAARATMAVALMIGFYLLALVIVALLLLTIYGQWQAGRLYWKLVIIAGAGAVVILWSIIPRPDTFNPPWPRLRAKDQPALFKKLMALSQATRQEMPKEVYLVPEVNAWVANRGGIMGVGSRRVMGIGLPLMQLLNVSQLTAVLAHEFGHYYGGDTSLGPWVYKTRGAIGRTLQNLEHHPSFLQAPFRWYGAWFLRVTHAVSRQQEFTADAFAARAESPQALISSLQQIHGHAGGFGSFWELFVMSALRRGYRPRIVDGYARFSGSDTAARFVKEAVAEEMKEGSENPYDTHPPLNQRIAALEKLPPGPSEDTTPSMSLLQDVKGLEDEILMLYGPPSFVNGLEPLEWEEYGQTLFIGEWEKVRAINRAVLEGLRVRELSRLQHDQAQLADRVPKVLAPDGSPVPDEQKASAFVAVLSAGLALALRDDGWEFVADPAEGVYFKKDDYKLDPDTIVVGLLFHEVDEAKWLEMCEDAGIGELPLIPRT